MVEDFEDNSLDFRIEITHGQILPPDASSGLPNITDSVDADDDNVDGTGQTGDGGHSWYVQDNTTRIHFSQLVLAAGVAWTDGDFAMRSIRFEAFDQNGASLGMVDAGDLSDESYQGTTAEDRFFGVRWGDGVTDGISSISFTSVGGNGLELDHIQFVAPLAGDFNDDQLVDATDIDLLAAAIRNNASDPIFDLSDDDKLNAQDLDLMIRDVLHTRRGDVNLDGSIGMQDFVILSNSFGEEAGWASGNISGETVDFADFLQLSTNFGFQSTKAKRAAVNGNGDGN